MEKLPEEPVIILVHPILKEELKIRKEELEKKLGYNVHGAMPVVSKIVGIELRQLRLKNKKLIKITAIKRNGEKKQDYFFA